MLDSNFLKIMAILIIVGICSCIILFFWISLVYLRAMRELKQSFIQVRQEYNTTVENIEDVVISLARTIDAKDRYTEGHTERVSQYALFLGERVGMTDEQLNNLRIGALIHDIGKIGVDQNVLNKPGILTPAERKQIESHPILGADICHPLASLHNVMPIIRNHHEKLDGSGYPDGLKGEEIPLEVRIVSIVDIFDALTTDRSYRSAMSIDEALGIIRREAELGKLDQFLVDEFEMVLNDMFSLVKDA